MKKRERRSPIHIGLPLAVVILLAGVPGAAAEEVQDPPLEGRILYGQNSEPGGAFAFGPQGVGVGTPYLWDQDIFSLDLDAGEHRPVATSNYYEESARWAPDGRSVAYSSDESGHAQIYLVQEGKDPRRLTSGSRHFYRPSWSPDGRWMAAVGCTDGGCRIYRMRSDGSNPVAITRGPYDYGAEWSPDGKWIVFTRQDVQEPGDAFHLYLVRPDGSFIKRISTGNVEGFSPRWSPDGQHIAFEGYDPPDSAGFASFHVYVMDRDGSNRRRLTSGDHLEDYYPCWSPDGSRIAFARSRMVYRPEDPVGFYSAVYAAADLYVTTLDGRVEQLTDTPHINEVQCDWS